jgi:hypothetical protein
MVVAGATDGRFGGTEVVGGTDAAVVGGADKVGATGRKVTAVVATVPAEAAEDGDCEECHHHPPAPAAKTATKTATNAGPPRPAPLDFFRLC